MARHGDPKHAHNYATRVCFMRNLCFTNFEWPCMAWHGHGKVIAKPWQCDDNAIAMPWQRHATAMALQCHGPWHGQGLLCIAAATPRQRHGNAMVLPWHPPPPPSSSSSSPPAPPPSPPHTIAPDTVLRLLFNGKVMTLE